MSKVIQYDNIIVQHNNRILNYLDYVRPSDLPGLLIETNGFDNSTMFQDISGTIPVVEGDPVRRIEAGVSFFTDDNTLIGGVFENGVLTQRNIHHASLKISIPLTGIFTDNSPYTLFVLDQLENSGGSNTPVTRPFLYLTQNGVNATYDGFRLSHANMGIPQGNMNNLPLAASNTSYTIPFFNTIRYTPAGRMWEGWQNGIKVSQLSQTFTPFTNSGRLRIVYSRTDSAIFYRKHYKLLLYNRALSDQEVVLINNYLTIISNSHKELTP